MRSSTSSSDARLVPRALALLVLVPTLLLGTFQVLRIPGDLTEDVFWARKVEWGDTFDIVIAGDSRTYRGISPEQLATFFPAARIGNFGFSSAALAGPYVERIRSLLSPTSSRPTVVLAVTPYSLTERATLENGFISQPSGGPPLRSAAWIGWCRQFVAPLSLDEIAVMLRDRSIFVGGNIYHEDGWVESTSPVYSALPAFDWARVDFEGNPVSPLLLAGLGDRVRDWTAQGVEVFAFVMPVTPELEDLEARLSGFDVERVAEALRSAGAVWLTPPGGFETYDRSHLTAPSAIEFSRWLGRALQALEERR